MDYHFGILDNKRIAYHNDTEFLIQISLSKNKKSAYKTKYRVVGNLQQAVFLYNSITIEKGHRKRLIMPAANNKLLSRHFS